MVRRILYRSHSFLDSAGVGQPVADVGGQVSRGTAGDRAVAAMPGDMGEPAGAAGKRQGIIGAGRVRADERAEIVAHGFE